MRKTIGNLGVLAALLLAASGSRAQSTLSLPIPEEKTHPRERISLTIKLPEKVEKIKDPPLVQPKLRSPVLDSYEFTVSKPIPRRQFVFETMRRLDRIGVRPDLASRRLIMNKGTKEYRIMGRAVWKYFEKLQDIYRKDALPRFEITPLDIERFRQVMNIFDHQFRVEFRNPLEADRVLVKMIEQLQAIKGEGTIKLVELKEAKDGSMVLEMEVRKEPLRGWQ